MKAQEQRIHKLLEKFERGEASPTELQELEVWYQSFESNGNITDNLSHQEETYARENLLTRILARVNTMPQAQQHLQADQYKKTRTLWPRIAAAAAIFIFLSAGGYFLFQRQRPNVELAQQLTEDFAPGSNKAVLTLAGGEKMVLTGIKNGQLAVQGNAVIRKTAGGELVYGTAGPGNGKVVYNTISTPRGGQYQLRLADGTAAWINAASTITYPVTFSGKNRTVEITGEVYFEVAHNAEKPFLVKSKGQTVEVLGTHFNINAYADEEETKTTLLEGRVHVFSAAVSSEGKYGTVDKDAPERNVILSPGQQAVFNKNTLRKTAADLSTALAWKSGYFQFINADIKTVMRQVSRWYNVDVVFEGPVTKEVFTGRISRSRNISQVLKMVQGSKSVQLTFSGRRIMVKM